MAIILAAFAATVAIYSFPPSSGSTLSGRSTSTTTTYQFSSTIPLARTYTNATVALDPRLFVGPPQGTLHTATDATMIAESLATSLGELPIQLVSHHVPTCSGVIYCEEDAFVFNTAKSSNLTVAFIGGSFYKLDYVIHDFSALYNDYYNNLTLTQYNQTSVDLSAAVASATVMKLMFNAYGIELSNMTLHSTIGNDWVELSQEYDGIQISNSGEIGVTFYTPTAEVMWLSMIENDGWHNIPASIPVQITASTALVIAEEYATNTLHMGPISYTNVSLQAVNDHMYYAATISAQSRTYVLFVNPISGEVGFPQ